MACAATISTKTLTVRRHSPATERSGPHAHQSPLMAGYGEGQNIVGDVAQQFSGIRCLQMKTLRAGGAAREFLGHPRAKSPGGLSALELMIQREGKTLGRGRRRAVFGRVANRSMVLD
jgi:hypothetical protein